MSEDLDKKSDEKLITIRLTPIQVKALQVALSFREEREIPNQCREIMMEELFDDELRAVFFSNTGTSYWSRRYSFQRESFSGLNMNDFMVHYTGGAFSGFSAKGLQKLFSENPDLFAEIIDWAYLPSNKRGPYPLVPGFRDALVYVASNNNLMTESMKLFYIKGFCQKGANHDIVRSIGLNKLADRPEYRKYIFQAKNGKAQRKIAMNLDFKKLPFIAGFEDKEAKAIIEGRMSGLAGRELRMFIHRKHYGV